MSHSARIVAWVGALAFLACVRNVEYEPGRFSFDWPGHKDLRPEVRRSLAQGFERDTALLTAKFQEPEVLEALRAANRRSPPTGNEIFRLEDEWEDADVSDPLVASLLEAECSRSLQSFRESFSQFAEVFVTDQSGRNACLSNKTSDYYQADEDWWKATYESRRSSHGQLEYDASAKVVAISIYVPVIDPKTGLVIGVGKGVLNRDVAGRR
jgi:hypothetical protein